MTESAQESAQPEPEPEPEAEEVFNARLNKTVTSFNSYLEERFDGMQVCVAVLVRHKPVEETLIMSPFNDDVTQQNLLEILAIHAEKVLGHPVTVTVQKKEV